MQLAEDFQIPVQKRVAMTVQSEFNKSSLKSCGKSSLLPLTAENGLARFMRY